MKKLLCLLLCVCFVLSAGCSSESGTNLASPSSGTQNETNATPEPSKSEVEESKNESPETVVENAIKAFQSGEIDAIAQHWNDTLSADLGSEDEETDNLMMSAMAENLSYSIVSTQVDEANQTAIVTVEFTNINMQDVFAEYMRQNIAAALEYAFLPEEEQPSEEELNQMYFDSFVSIIGENKDNTVTNTVDVSLALNNEVWEITSGATAFDAMLGGLYSYLENMSNELAS